MGKQKDCTEARQLTGESVGRGSTGKTSKIACPIQPESSALIISSSAMMSPRPTLMNVVGLFDCLRSAVAAREKHGRISAIGLVYTSVQDRWCGDGTISG